METEHSHHEGENKPEITEFSIADMLESSNNQSHDVQIMRHYLLRMMKRKSHEVKFFLSI